MKFEEDNWNKCAEILPPDGEIVLTKIDDEGERKVQKLKKQGNLWWTADGAMYVYYVPTHWKSL